MHTITVKGEGVAIEVLPDETILTALHRTGHALRVGCRRGGCAVCKVNVLEGEFEYTRPIADKVITEQEAADGVCLTCRAVPRSDMLVELRQDDLRRQSTLLAFYTKQVEESQARLAAQKAATAE